MHRDQHGELMHSAGEERDADQRRRFRVGDIRRQAGSHHSGYGQHEVVILTQILADDINRGYGHLYNEAIAKLYGVPPRDIEDFVARLSAARGVVEIETTSGGMIMLDTDEVRKATPRILERYHIPRDRTPGLPGSVHAPQALRAAP